MSNKKRTALYTGVTNDLLRLRFAPRNSAQDDRIG
jgi:predicted GIY-YIG superfamily endonuclease